MHLIMLKGLSSSPGPSFSDKGTAQDANQILQGTIFLPMDLG